MTDDFRTVYRSDEGEAVRLEAAVLTTATGEGYLHHRLVFGGGETGAVIIARRGDDLLLVHSDRPAAARGLWELPRGAGNPDDADACATAARELAEETGMRATATAELGRYLTDSTIYPQPVVVVLCDVDEEAQRSARDGEIDDERWVPASELDGLIRDGVIEDAHSLSALAIWRARRENA